MKGYTELEGVRVKFRTEDRNGQRLATATLWIDGKPYQEIATLDLALVERPGDPTCQGWVDAVSAVFNAWLARATGLPGLETRRRAPDRKGER